MKTHAPNMCLEVNGNFLTQELCDGSPEQLFYTSLIGTQTRIHASNDTCLDIMGNLSDMGQIASHVCTSGNEHNQGFILNGETIVSGASGKCLDVPMYSTDAGEIIVQYTCENRDNQKFTTSNEATSCTVNNNYLCQYPQDVTYCDHQKYTCDETREEVSLNSFDIVYNSPISDQCENNAIVLLSDGQPYVPDRIQFDETMVSVKALTGATTDCVDSSDGRCGVELASFLAGQDQSDDVEGDNVINTYTIGFDVGAGSMAEVFLKSVAEAGEGEYFPASDAAALAAVFKNIVADVSKTARSYSAPTYTVDQSSLLSHSRDVYIPLFENAATPRWSGNLKKFKLNDTGQIIDKTGKVAVSDYGVLDAEAVDFWSATPPTDDPDPITTGGAASQLVPASRKLLTDNGSALVTLDATSVTKAAMSGGVTTITDAEHAAMLRFIQGYEEDGTARNHIGDILHNKPMVVSYSDKEVVFFGTNEGYIHAINTADADTTGGGKELFAYMPSALLSNIPGQYENSPLTGDIKRIYGVDGEVTVWLNDKNNNGRVDAGDGESAYLFFGLRRGGNGYYALNVTNPSNPSLMWSITNNTTGFSQLAQSWSKPVAARLRYKEGTAVKYEEVLVFGGGYDASVYDEEDAALRDLTNVKGNAVYIVNAKTGSLIWSKSGGDLNHSIAGSIRVLDLDRNGSIDRMYFGDLGGNVWRADLNMDDIDDDASLNDVKKDARVYRLASLGVSAGASHRMFFYEPDVSLFKHKGELVTLIAIGSGYRSHPKNTDVQDLFYVLRDVNATNVPKTVPSTLTESDLVSNSVLAGADFMPTYKGWYTDLSQNTGEKSLSSPLIFMNKVMFTTFGLSSSVENTGGADSCTIKSNNLSRAYVMDLVKGAATVDLDGDGVITDNDESVLVGIGDIPDSPKLVFDEPSNCDKDGCDQFVDVRIGKLQTPLIDQNTTNGNTNLPVVHLLNHNFQMIDFSTSLMINPLNQCQCRYF
ncbi:PilC/PilY family type IV pilus protein [Leucothrix pacifica]|nr:PilC/PilY family type IV pilus protein [Leucothrix pacifica]